jgi:hypothetical protein
MVAARKIFAPKHTSCRREIHNPAIRNRYRNVETVLATSPNEKPDKFSHTLKLCRPYSLCSDGTLNNPTVY